MQRPEQRVGGGSRKAEAMRASVAATGEPAASDGACRGAGTSSSRFLKTLNPKP